MLIKNSMIITIISYFPDIHKKYFESSILGKLIKNNKLYIQYISIIQFAKLHNIRKIDDKVYGGGNGMLMRFDFIYKLFSYYNIFTKQILIIHPSPSGVPLCNKLIIDLTKENYKNYHYVFICSRYEGIDKRIIDYYNAYEINIGDYILYDGDVASMVIYGSLIRNYFIKKEANLVESFQNNLLEHDQYTKPKYFQGLSVPQCLSSGNHQKISFWRYKNSLEKTKKTRPFMYQQYIKKCPNFKEEENNNLK